MAKEDFLSVGGQAIVEGVMMRSPKFFAVACRAPNKELIVKAEPIEKTWIGRQKWLKIPFLRGSWALLDAMTLGARAMKFASDVQLAPEYQPVQEGKDLNAEPEKVMDKRIQDGVIIGVLIFSLAMSLFIFKVLPQLAGSALRSKVGLVGGQTNFVVEMVKFVFFIGYLLAISRLEGVKEVFRYHGAEHKAINALEAEQELTLENCQAQTRLHPRCGTSFAIIVLILGFFVFPFVPRFEKLVPRFENNLLMEVLGNAALHIAMLPLVAGVAYELLRFAGKFRDNSAVMLMFKPGLWTQLITTQEPRDEHVEVAIASLKACLDGEAAIKSNLESK